MSKAPMRFRDTPQTEALPFSTAAEALMVDPWVMHHAAAMMLAAIVIAAGKKSIFTASLEVAARLGHLLTSSFVSHPFLLIYTHLTYIFFHICPMHEGLVFPLSPTSKSEGFERCSFPMEEFAHELVVQQPQRLH